MQTVRSSDGFAPPTMQFELKGSSSHTATPTSNVFTLVQPKNVRALPKGTSDVGSFLARWQATPERRAGLAGGRKELAEVLADAGEVSVRSIRLALGLSQADVAARMQTSQSHVARIEAGTCDPNLDTLRRLASALKTDLNTLNNAIPAKG